MRTSTIFAIASSIVAVSAADCAGPGDYDSQGRYSCNPAHQYPNGQTCKTIDGCPLLVDANGKAIVKSDSTTTSAAPQTTSTCAPGGSYDSQGCYSCNPAHQYPDGVTCKFINGCPLLVGSDGNVVISSSASSAAPTSTAPASNCAAPGAYDSKGRYSCNPAHQYPNGQSCKTIDGCPLLVGSDGKPIVKTSGGTNTMTVGPTQTMPPITNSGSALKGGVALVAAVFAAVI
ncbi:hypothetical protein PWT90_01034 [Aphanocladium album]|nr:hypothetical protein PWT90_01034 [Aphanocladium album]